MTRRERHLRIIESFGSDWARRALIRMIDRKGLKGLPDEVVEDLARELWDDRCRRNRMNDQNRKIAAARAAQALTAGA